jgi:hypothetical protein
MSAPRVWPCRDLEKLYTKSLLIHQARER